MEAIRSAKVILPALAALVAFAAPPTQAASRSSSATRAEMREGLPATAEEEKRQVPKPEPDDKKKRKEPAGTKEAEKKADEDSPWWSDCLFDFFSNALFGRSDEDAEAAGIATASGLRSGALLQWSVGNLGIILPSDTLTYAVDLWDGPGGRHAERAVLASLRIGTEVEVAETRSWPGGSWLMVKTNEEAVPPGWVAAADVSALEARPGSRAGSTTTRSPPPVPLPERSGPPSTATIVSLSSFASGPRDVWLEYDRGPAFGIQQVWRTDGGITFGPRIGYSIARGTPRSDYVTPTRYETPTRSTLQIFDVTLHAGQHVPIGAGTVVFHYGLGPALYWVGESADVQYYVRSPADSSLVPAGTGEERLGRWRLGGDAAVGLALRVARSSRLGVTVRGFAISWDSQRKKSLTTDFIGKKPLVGFDLGVTLGHDRF